MVAGSWLGWLAIGSSGIAFEGGSAPGQMSGLDVGPYAWVALGAGLVLAAAGLGALLRSGLRRPAGMAAVVAGAIAVAAAIAVWLTREALFTDFVVREAASTDLSAATIRDLLGRLFQTGAVGVRPAPGLYLVGIGGLVGALAAVLVRRKPRPAPENVSNTLLSRRAARSVGGEVQSLGRPLAGDERATER